MRKTKTILLPINLKSMTKFSICDLHSQLQKKTRADLVREIINLFKKLIVVFFLLFSIKSQAQTQVNTQIYTDFAYPQVEPAYNYNYVTPLKADILAEAPNAYTPSYSHRFFMSVFGPRYKSEAGSSIGYFDFHQGSDMTVNVDFDGETFDEDNPPNLYCRCDGVVDQIIDGTDAEMEQLGTGRSVRIKCDELFAGHPEWGHIYIAYRHLTSVAVGLMEDDPISQDDVIGIMGASGHTSNYHLHYSLQYKIDPNSYRNVHPMRTFDPTATPHLLSYLEDAEIYHLGDWADSAMFRLIVPYNQANIRAIHVELPNNAYDKVYDFEQVSINAGNDRDNHEYVDGLALFAYPFNRGSSAWFRYGTNKDDFPAAYPASPKRMGVNEFPFIEAGLYLTPAYVLDLKVKDLPLNYDINQLKISIIDIYGHGIQTDNPPLALSEEEKQAPEEEPNITRIEYFPNPVLEDNITLKLPPFFQKKGQIEVWNSLGQREFQIDFDATHQAIVTLHMNDLATGLYLVKVQVGRKQEWVKVVKD